MLNLHEAASPKEMHKLVTQQVNGEVIHSAVPGAWMESLSSTGCKLSGELRKEHGLQGSFLEGMARSHKVGPRK